jgi:hypothetical protein
MFSLVESQVIFRSKDTPIVSVGLRTAVVPYTNQNKTAWKSKSDKWWDRPKKYICVFTVTCQKNLGSVGRHYFFFFLLSAKPEIVVPWSGIRFRYFIFEIFGKPSFVSWRVTQFFYLLCSQFRQKASGWINKTLLLIKQQKWLSEFCIKIDRVASQN